MLLFFACSGILTNVAEYSIAGSGEERETVGNTVVCK